jgi:hypothetical protein
LVKEYINPYCYNIRYVTKAINSNFFYRNIK